MNRFAKRLEETPEGTPVTIRGFVAGRSDNVDLETGARNAKVTVVDAVGKGVWTSEVPESALTREERR